MRVMVCCVKCAWSVEYLPRSLHDSITLGQGGACRMYTRLTVSASAAGNELFVTLQALSQCIRLQPILAAWRSNAETKSAVQNNAA